MQLNLTAISLSTPDPPRPKIPPENSEHRHFSLASLVLTVLAPPSQVKYGAALGLISRFNAVLDFKLVFKRVGVLLE